MTCSASLCALTSIRTVGPRPRAPVAGPASPVSTSLSPPRNPCGSSGRSSSRRVRSVRVLPSALCGSGGRVACLRRPYSRLCRALAAAFFLYRARAAGVAENQTSNLRVGSSNLSERAKDFNGLWPLHRSNHKIKTVFRTVNFFGASPLGRAPSVWRPEQHNRLRQNTAMISGRASAIQAIPDVVRRRRRMRRASGRSHSVPRPACGDAMLTLLRVRRTARLWRRPKLDGASRPLRSAGSWRPSFRLSARLPPCGFFSGPSGHLFLRCEHPEEDQTRTDPSKKH